MSSSMLCLRAFLFFKVITLCRLSKLKEKLEMFFFKNKTTYSMYTYTLYGHYSIESDVISVNIVVPIADFIDPPEGPILRYCPTLLQPYGQQFKLLIYPPTHPTAIVWSENFGLRGYPYEVVINHPHVNTHTTPEFLCQQPHTRESGTCA